MDIIVARVFKRCMALSEKAGRRQCLCPCATLLSSEELFPELVEIILTRLTKISEGLKLKNSAKNILVMLDLFMRPDKDVLGSLTLKIYLHKESLVKTPRLCTARGFIASSPAFSSACRFRREWCLQLLVQPKELLHALPVPRLVRGDRGRPQAVEG